MNIDFLENYGMDTKSGVERCLGDESFYVKLLSMFLDDKAFSNAQRAYADKNYKALFIALHDLKGTSGNAGMTELFKAVAPLVEQVRGGGVPGADFDAQFASASAAYEKACEGIRKLQ